jgi:hypothetical protein
MGCSGVMRYKLLGIVSSLSCLSGCYAWLSTSDYYQNGRGSRTANNGAFHQLERSTSKLFLGPQQLGEFEVLDITDSPASRRVPLLDYSATGSPIIPFETAWDWQKELLDNHVERLSREIPASQFLYETKKINQSGLDTVIMLQHAPVYTLGTGSDEKFVLYGKSDVPVVRMDRGGEV